MSVIRLDAETLAKFRAAGGRVVLADEAGNPVQAWEELPLQPIDREPNFTPEEWRRIMSSPVKYTTEEAIRLLQKRDA